MGFEAEDSTASELAAILEPDVGPFSIMVGPDSPVELEPAVVEDEPIPLAVPLAEGPGETLGVDFIGVGAETLEPALVV